MVCDGEMAAITSVEPLYFIPDKAWHRGKLLEPDPLNPIAKALAVLARFGETFQDRAQFVGDVGVFDIFLPELIQARARDVAAEVKLIFSGSAADESNFSHVRTRASVRAPGHTNNDFFVAQTEFSEQTFDACDEFWRK